MPIFGLGLHIIVALFFAIHAVRNGRPMYWLLILFTFPLLGSIVYFFAEYLPSSNVDRTVRKASNVTLKILDPTRELRDARRAFEMTPTIQNRMRLAAALDNAGEFDEAAEQFDACLKGPFAEDQEVCFGAAKAKFHNRQHQECIALLLKIRAKQENFRPEELTLLLANAYAESGIQDKAKEEFITAMDRHGSPETLLQYALWSVSAGDIATAKNLKEEIDKLWKGWNKHTRNLHKPKIDQLASALDSAGSK